MTLLDDAKAVGIKIDEKSAATLRSLIDTCNGNRKIAATQHQQPS